MAMKTTSIKILTTHAYIKVFCTEEEYKQGKINFLAFLCLYVFWSPQLSLNEISVGTKFRQRFSAWILQFVVKINMLETEKYCYYQHGIFGFENLNIK